MPKEIRIDGPIGGFMNDSESFNMRVDELDLKPSDTLELIINSPGGSVIEGWGIYNRLKSMDNAVNVRVEGLAASIASLIALAGDNVGISEVGSFMIHRASTFAEGNQKDLEKQIQTLQTIDETLINVYQSKTGETREQIEEWLDEEKWFSPEEALEVGFADEIINKLDSRMAALYYPKHETMTKFEKLMALLNGETATEETPEVETVVEETPEVVEETPAAPEVVADTEQENGMLNKTQVASMIKAALAPIKESLNALKASQKKAVEEQEIVAEAVVRKVAKGITTKGVVPAPSNENHDGAGYLDPQAAFRDRMKKIEETTRLK